MKGSGGFQRPEAMPRSCAMVGSYYLTALNMVSSPVGGAGGPDRRVGSGWEGDLMGLGLARWQSVTKMPLALRSLEKGESGFEG